MRSYAVTTLVVFALWLADTARAQGSDWPAPLPAQASAQQATTEQGAMTAADATDAQPTNIFVSLRINSPGDNGPVTQTSTTAVAGDTANDAATAQDGWQDWAAGAVGDRPADPSAPVSCVNVVPGTDATRIVIALGMSCHHHVAPRRAAAA